MKKGKKQAVTIVMAAALALATAATTLSVPVYAQETENMQTSAEDETTNDSLEEETIPEETESIDSTETTATESTEETAEVESEEESAETGETKENLEKQMLKTNTEKGFFLQALDEIAIDETNFPDAVFRQYISENYDTDKDNALSDAEIEAVETIQVTGKNIYSLEGINYFSSLKRLYCGNTRITSLDVSQNTLLTNLQCNSRTLSYLNVSGCTQLKELLCTDTNLTSLDISTCSALTQLYCNRTKLTSLDISNNHEISILQISETGITSIDLSNNNKLSSLNCWETELTSLDVSGKYSMWYLNCHNTKIKHLDISDTRLTSLICNGNNLAWLNIGNTLTSTLKKSNSVFRDVELNGTSFDLKTLDEEIDVSKVTILSGGDSTLSGTTVSGVSADTPLVYRYNCGTFSGATQYLDVTVYFSGRESNISFNQSFGDRTYTGNPVSLTTEDYTVTGSTGEVTFAYQKKNADGEWENVDSVIDVGIYRVQATVAEDDIYNSQTSEWKEFAITIANNTIVSSLPASSYITYGEPVPEFTAVCKFGEPTIIYKDSNGTEYTEENVPKNLTAGRWLVRISSDRTSNYVGNTLQAFIIVNKATAPEVKEPQGLTADYGQTLSDIALTDGWIWAEPDTSVEINNNGYAARLAVDDANYDYTQVAGYNADGHYVERTLPVTVNINMEPLNEVPTITANDKTITVGDTFNPLDGVTASDSEDGDLTEKIEIVGNDVNTSAAGTYSVTYKVTDSEGASVTKTVMVTVNPKMEPLNEAPTITANDKTITVGDMFNPLDGVTASDSEDGNLTEKIEVVSNDVNTSAAGTYSVTYKVTDSEGASATKTVTVVIEEKETEEKETEEKDTKDTPDTGQKPGDNEKTDNGSNFNDGKNSVNRNSTNSADSPKTGDRTNTGLWGALLVLSGGALALITGKRRRDSKKNK